MNTGRRSYGRDRSTRNQQETRIAFEDRSLEWGLPPSNYILEKQPKNIEETFGSGCAFADLNGDHFDEAIVVHHNGIRIYRNDSGKGFTDISKTWAPALSGRLHGIAAGERCGVMAANSAVAQTGALVNTSAGATGDGGAIEFSARKNVELAGGQFRASSTTGTMGTVLIDPETVTVSADYYSGGANHNIVADNAITVNAGVVVSTRNAVLEGQIVGEVYQGERQTQAPNLNLDGYQQSQKARAQRAQLIIGQYIPIYNKTTGTLRYALSGTSDQVLIDAIRITSHGGIYLPATVLTQAPTQPDPQAGAVLLEQAYPRLADGGALMPFRRLFLLLHRSG